MIVESVIGERVIFFPQFYFSEAAKEVWLNEQLIELNDLNKC
ncbi:hypothetical protein [Halobacillus sp. A5]|nr:hypothetical protein [Halobacillus sp. A5]